ncbi:MAG: response regulator, partial [Pseudomonadota bacterium]|nr:response regulator [Pseudomonadota bacterium]
TFEIYLPLIDPPPSADIESPRPPIRSKRILVVDDNADAADSLASLLAMEGHQTEAVYTAHAALDRAASSKPDVVLLDIGLPDMTGYEVAERMRPILDEVRLIALTGYGQAEDIQRARAAGFDAHVIKPVDFNMLERVIGEFTASKPDAAPDASR